MIPPLGNMRTDVRKQAGHSRVGWALALCVPLLTARLLTTKAHTRRLGFFGPSNEEKQQAEELSAMTEEFNLKSLMARVKQTQLDHEIDTSMGDIKQSAVSTKNSIFSKLEELENSTDAREFAAAAEERGVFKLSH